LKYEKAPNNRFHSDRAGRGVDSVFVLVEINSLFKKQLNYSNNKFHITRRFQSDALKTARR
jgi:hypothetical protein